MLKKGLFIQVQLSCNLLMSRMLDNTKTIPIKLNKNSHISILFLFFKIRQIRYLRLQDGFTIPHQELSGTGNILICTKLTQPKHRRLYWKLLEAFLSSTTNLIMWKVDNCKWQQERQIIRHKVQHQMVLLCILVIAKMIIFIMWG